MSFNAPASYVASAAPQLGVPSMLSSDPLLQFKGARTVIKSVPASTGSAIGPGTAVQFQIPMSTNGFIRPNSMYLRFRIDVTQPSVGTAYWAFAGQNGVTPSTASTAGGIGGAGSLIDRATVMFPGGVTMTYPYYNHFRNAVTPHVLMPDYFAQDLRELEMCGVYRSNGAIGVDENISRRAYLVHPLDLPVFNSPTAVPLLLLSGGITIELLTTSVIQGLFSNAASLVTNFALSELSLVYEEIVVSPEFKTALVSSVAERPFSIGVSDRTALGVFDGGANIRVNIGVGLSSLKAVVGTVQPAVTAVNSQKRYTAEGLIRWNLYLNGQQITPPNLDNDAATYAETNRALSTFNDYLRCSSMIGNQTADFVTNRNSYTSHAFLFGCSTAVYNDGAFALSGVPADQIAVETERGTQDASKWQVAAGPSVGSAQYMWALHDSVLTVLPDGTISIRK